VTLATLTLPALDSKAFAHSHCADIMLLCRTGVVVTLAYRYYDQKTYAVKAISKERAQRKRVTKYVVNERRVLLMLNHPNILKLHWTSRDATNVYMIYEHVPKGELWEMLQKLPNKRVPEPLAKFWLGEIILALEYLAQKGIAHRDLKPENILLRDNWHLVLCDFGTSKVLADLINLQKRREAAFEAEAKRFDESEERRKKAAAEANAKGDVAPMPRPADTLSDEEHRRRSIAYAATRNDSFTGTPEYMAPEIVKTRVPTHLMLRAADLWALGVMMYQFLTGFLPFRGGPYAIFQQAVESKIKFPAHISPEARDLLQRLLEPDPIKRLMRCIGDVGIFGSPIAGSEQVEFYENDDAYNDNKPSSFKPLGLEDPADLKVAFSNLPFSTTAFPKTTERITFEKLKRHPFLTSGESPLKWTDTLPLWEQTVPYQDMLKELHPLPIPQSSEAIPEGEEVDDSALEAILDKEFPAMNVEFIEPSQSETAATTAGSGLDGAGKDQ